MAAIVTLKNFEFCQNFANTQALLRMKVMVSIFQQHLVLHSPMVNIFTLLKSTMITSLIIAKKQNVENL